MNIDPVDSGVSDKSIKSCLKFGRIKCTIFNQNTQDAFVGDFPEANVLDRIPLEESAEGGAVRAVFVKDQISCVIRALGGETEGVRASGKAGDADGFAEWTVTQSKPPTPPTSFSVPLRPRPQTNGWRTED